MAHDYRAISYLDQEDINSILKPIVKPQVSENAFFEEVDQQMSAKEFYKFDNISDVTEDEIIGVTEPEDINVEDMEIDDKIDLVKKLITNIFDSREENNNLFLDSFVDFKKLSERYIYEIDPEWVDEEEEAQQEENQPPEFEEALQNSTEEQPVEEVAPEEETVAPEDQPGADQEVAPSESEEDLINNAFA